MFFSEKKLSRDLSLLLKKDLLTSYRVIIELKNKNILIDDIIKRLKGVLINNINSIGLVSAQLTPFAIKRLIEYPDIKFVSLDEYCFLCGLSLTTANKASFRQYSTLTGKGISIALLDSGAFPHPDLISPQNKIAEFHDLINEYKYPYDDNGHGTALASLLCGSGISSRFLYKGIAENSNLIIYKVFNKLGRAYLSDIFYTLDSIITQIKNGTIIKLLLLPFENFSTNLKHIDYFNELLSILISLGSIPIMPIGSNSNSYNSISGLALNSNSILVGGLENMSSTPVAYSFSSCGSKKIAPLVSFCCSNIICANTDPNYISERNSIKLYPHKLKDNYKTLSGTSVSSTYLCGLCALLLEKYPEYNFNDVKSKIELCSQEIEGLDFNHIGRGTLNLEEFLK